MSNWAFTYLTIYFFTIFIFKVLSTLCQILTKPITFWWVATIFCCLFSSWRFLSERYCCCVEYTQEIFSFKKILNYRFHHKFYLRAPIVQSSVSPHPILTLSQFPRNISSGPEYLNYHKFFFWVIKIYDFEIFMQWSQTV